LSCVTSRSDERLLSRQRNSAICEINRLGMCRPATLCSFKCDRCLRSLQAKRAVIRRALLGPTAALRVAP
jgi:hypothetical protein